MLKRKWPLLPMLCLVLGNGYSLEGAGQTTWRRTYGGLGPDDCAAVALTSDQGFLLCGSTGSFGDGGDIYVVKTDDQGLLQWSIPFGGSGVQFGVAYLEDPEGVVVAGTNAQGPEGGYDMCLARLSSSVLVYSNLQTEAAHGHKQADLFTGGDYKGHRLTVSNNNGNFLLAATSQGIYRTINGGTTWEQVKTGEHWDIKFKPGNDSVVYATSGGAIFYSNNGGRSGTWNTATLIFQ